MTAICVAVAACAGGSQPRESVRIETEIEHALEARAGVPLRVRCAWLPPSCRAELPDATALRVVIAVGAGGVLEWRVDGALVIARDLEAYLQEAVTDLGEPQVARCGARIRGIAVGERIECGLSRGGRAFVVVNADGSTSIEIQLDANAGAARAEVVTVDRDEQLFQMSRELEQADEEVDD